MPLSFPPGIAAAEVGMKVRSSLGVGSITKVLKHPIFSEVRRFRLPTKHGLLYGTLDHPIHVGGEWLEVSEAHRWPATRRPARA